MTSITIPFSDVRLARRGCTRVMEMLVHHDVAMRINRLARALDPFITDIELARKKILETQAIRDDDGKLMEREDGSIIVKSEFEFDQEFRKCLEQTVDVQLNGFVKFQPQELLPAIECKDCKLMVRDSKCPKCKSSLVRVVPAGLFYELSPFVESDIEEDND